MLVHIFVDEYGGILGIFPVTDDFFLWAYAPFVLSSSDISDLYTSHDPTNNASDLEGFWKFDGGYTDSSGNSNTLTAYNSPVFSTDIAFPAGTIITTSTTTYTYATTSAGYANPHAVTQISPPTFSATTPLVYDNNGNLTQSGTTNGTTTYAWDYRNRMTGSATSTQTGTTTYAYDHTDQRIKKVFGNTTNIYVNKFYDLTTSTATSSASTSAYIWVGDVLLAFVEGNGYATSTYFVHPDHLGSTNVVTNSSGNVTQAIDYYPFGTRRINSGPDVSGREFIGQFYDEASALSYLNARYYEGNRGQFLSEDPTHLAIGDAARLQRVTGFSQGYFLSDPQLLNSYSYGRNNPVRFSDPNGNCPWCIPFLVGGVAGGVGTWVGDMLQNRAEVMTGLSVLTPRSSWQEYNAAIATGAITGSVGTARVIYGGIAATLGSLGEDWIGGGDISVGKAVTTGILTTAAGGLFKSVVGESPVEQFIKSKGRYDKLPWAVVKNEIKHAGTGEILPTSGGAIIQQNFSAGVSRNPSQGVSSGSPGSSGGNLNSILGSLSRILSTLSSLLSSWKR
ncbi:MAG: hypothetical protein A3I38_02440 [Candidatus Wildermuthbacteria bacterium RIFCSPLOWO2_02_FULL_47_10]|nr:MAG: hypothetical protein A3I38_02440 [Candidatus Wildermuthbacteria bacterium RIFCSPLOWO2_02_FULL_47_10]